MQIPGTYSEIEVGIDRSLKIMQKSKTSQGGGEEGEKNGITWPSLRKAKIKQEFDT